jgi:hypothetical protein
MSALPPVADIRQCRSPSKRWRLVWAAACGARRAEPVNVGVCVSRKKHIEVVYVLCGQAESTRFSANWHNVGRLREYSDRRGFHEVLELQQRQSRRSKLLQLVWIIFGTPVLEMRSSQSSRVAILQRLRQSHHEPRARTGFKSVSWDCPPCRNGHPIGTRGRA